MKLFNRKRDVRSAAHDPAHEAEAYYTASQSQLIWRRFRKHKLAMGSAVVLIILYALAIFAPFSVRGTLMSGIWRTGQHHHRRFISEMKMDSACDRLFIL